MFCFKKISPLFLFFCFVQPLLAQNCDNVGFENGTTGGWICTSGNFGSLTLTDCDAVLPITLTDGVCQNQGGIDGSLTPASPLENRHTIMSDKTGTDANSLNNVPFVAPGALFPDGVNVYSFRIGNGLGNESADLALAESIKFPFTVTSQNAGLTYMYAAFLREALPAIHRINQAPRFEIKITEKKNGGDSLISCGYYEVVAGAATNFLTGASDNQGLWRYTNWTKVALDLTGYIGKQLTIEFRTTDCFPGQQFGGGCRYRPGAHSAYAYIDLYCTPVTMISPAICANQASVELCAPPGYATYQWPAGQPGIVPPLDKQCVTINNPKSGDKYTVNMTSVSGGCPSNTTISLSGAELKVRDTTVCLGAAPFHLNAKPTTPGNYDFKWTPATNLSCTDCLSPIFTPGSTTTYTVIMSDKNVANCNSEKIVNVRVEDLKVDAGKDQRICAGSTVTLAGSFSGTATGGVWTGGTGKLSSLIDPNATYTPSAAEEAAGKAVLQFSAVTTNNNVSCPNSVDEMVITIDRIPTVNAGNGASVCIGTPIKLAGSVGGSATSAVWSGGTGTFYPDDSTLTATYTPSTADITGGTVKLTLTSNATGICPASVSEVTFNIYPNPIVNFAVDTPKACPPHCVDFFDSTIVGGGTKIVKWKWEFSNGTNAGNDHPTEICFEKPGYYDVKLTATSDKNCSTELLKKAMIETFEKPTAEFTVNPNSVSVYDPTVQLKDQSSTDVISWKWNLGDNTIIAPNKKNPVHQYPLGISGIYMVKLYVVNQNGCKDSAMHPVEVRPEFTFYIPNAFTPTRNDGTNDTFFGKGVGIVKYHIWIFDRWGNMIFNTENLNTGWDGRANNGADEAQQDVYVWKVKLTDVFGKGHEYIGTVTLVR